MNKLNDEIASILTTSEINGGKYWSRKDGDIHAPHGFSTIDVLNTLGEIGLKYNESKLIQETIDFILSYLDDNGCFKYSPKSSKLPCITARILTAFGKLKYPIDEKIKKCYRNLLETQNDDGGWRCATVKIGKSPGTDASNPGTTLYVLDAFRFRSNSKIEKNKLDNGIQFLLRHWETRKPLGPCNFGIGSRFLSIEFPFLRYNLFYYVFVLSFFKSAQKDERFIDAKNALIERSKNNEIYPETPHKAWNKYSFSQKNKKSEIATKLFLEVLK